MTATIPAGQLTYDHIGSRVSWTIPDPEALLEESTPFGTLDWVSHSEGMTVLGVTFIEPADRATPGYRTTRLDGKQVVVTSDDYWLDPRTTITVDLEDAAQMYEGEQSLTADRPGETPPLEPSQTGQR